MAFEISFTIVSEKDAMEERSPVGRVGVRQGVIAVHIAVIFQRQVKVVVLVGSGGLKRYGDDVRRHFDVDKTELVGIILAVKRPDDRKIL